MKNIFKRKIPAEYWLLFAILILAILIRTIFFVGLNWSDDPGYAFDAHYISQGNIPEGNYVNGLRSMTIYPLALFMKIFGINQFSLVIYQLICSIGEISLCYLFAAKAFDKKTGILSAFLMTVYTLDILLSTWALPDVPLSFFTSLAMYVFFSAEIAFKSGSIEQSKKLQYILRFLVVGFIIGFAYLIKESGIIILIFFPLYFLYDIIKNIFLHKKFYLKSVWKYALVLIGFLIIFTAEGLFYYKLHGDFLNRYHVLNSYFNREDAQRLGALNIDLRFYPSLMFNINYQGKFMKNNVQMPYGLYYYALAIGFISILIRFAVETLRKKFCKKNTLNIKEIKKREYMAFFLIWFFAVFLFLQFGSFSLKNYSPLHRLDRHLALISVPTILLIAYFITQFLFADSGRSNKLSLFFKVAIGILLILLLTLNSIYMTKNIHATLMESTKDTSSIYQYLTYANFKKTVYLDGGTMGMIIFYSGFNNSIGLDNIENFDCNSTHDVYVILNSTRGWFDKAPFYYNLPECVRNVPENWLFITEFDEAKKQIYQKYNPSLYYVP